MDDSPFGVTRRTFLKAAGASLALHSPQSPAAPTTATRETLYNGIVLPSPWPPRRVAPTGRPERAPYLASPPAVINIDVGRQLFVDDFLIEESSLHRTFHQATYHPASPVLTPVLDWEKRDPHAINTGGQPSQSAMVFSDGVFFDPADRLFKMWYMGGYQQATALATSRDGLAWQRPSLDVVAGTNIVSPNPRDSNTVWLDLDSSDRGARFKMASYDLPAGVLRLSVSADGVHWRPAGTAGRGGDRSTFFYNPFRNVWTFSLRADDETGLVRYRRYAESRAFEAARWADDGPVAWTAADSLDLIRADLKTRPQIYNLDAVAYESVMLGLFTMFRGERSDREKPNDLCVGFSRDGFHWSREGRDPFIPVSERAGDWNWGNVQSAGGVCLVVGDRLYFYVSGRSGIPGTGLPGVCSTGLATLRRDGFASVSDVWPEGQPRPVLRHRSSLITRPVRFSGRHLFVNAVVSGELRVDVLDREGRAIGTFAAGRMQPVSGDNTRHAVRWQGGASLEELAGEPVRFRFTLFRGQLFSFWVSDAPSGRSRGYLAAGGPGFRRPYDGD